MIDFLFYVIILISICGVIGLGIVLWQYVTGLPYWGSERTSMTIPTLVCCAIPVLNVFFIALVIIVIGLACLKSILQDTRRNAITRRSKINARSKCL